MLYISLSECIRGLTEPIALKRDKVAGWHVTVLKEHAASVEEICAEVNLLDPNDADLKIISGLFSGVHDIVKRERESYAKALKDVGGVSETIQSYKITNQSLLFDLAFKAAEESGLKVSRSIRDFAIKDQERLFRIAAVAAAQNGEGVSEFIENYGLEEEGKRYLIALKAAAQDGWGVAMHIENYGISDQEKLFQIAALGAGQGQEGFSQNFGNFGISDEEKRYEIALIAAAHDGGGVSHHIKNYRITSEEWLFQIALTGAANSGWGVSANLEEYCFKDREKLYQLALKAAKQSGFGVSKHIQSYAIKDQERLFRIALTAAATNGWGVSAYIPQYGIKEEEKRYQIALVAAAQCGDWVTSNIRNYNITNKERLFRIAVKAILQEPEKTANNLKNYNYGLDKDLTQTLRLFAKSLYDPSQSHREAFLALILEWRKRELPPFLVAENPDPIVQQKLRRWVIELLPLGITNEQMERERPLFTQLMQLRNPGLRSQITAYLPDVYNNQEAWDALQAINIKIPKKDYSQLVRLLLLGHDPHMLSVFYSKVDDPLDQELYLTFLLRVKALKVEAQAQLLKQIEPKSMLPFMRTAIDIISFGHPELVRGDLDKQLEYLFLSELQGLKVANFKEAYEKTINKFRKKELIFTYLSSLSKEAAPYFKDIIEFILNGTFCDKRYDIPHLKMIFAKFPIEENWRKGEQGLDLRIEPVENTPQIPISLAEMRAKIITDKHLPLRDGSPLYRCLMGESREECLQEAQSKIRTEVKEDLKIEIKCLQLLDPELTEGNKNKYLGELEHLCQNTQFQNDVKAWAALMKPVTSRNDYLVSDTDDPNHLFLIGEEVSGSCQKITGGDPALNKGLLGYMLNGYNRAVVVTDKNGAIVARRLIRLYWDGERPVLYQERFYTRSSDAKLKPLVDAMCLRRAKALNLPLVSAESGKPYPKTLEITGGRADIEYIDAIGGIQTSKHKVQTSYEV